MGASEIVPATDLVQSPFILGFYVVARNISVTETGSVIFPCNFSLIRLPGSCPAFLFLIFLHCEFLLFHIESF